MVGLRRRWHGTRTECDHVVHQLATVLRVVSISAPDPDRVRSVLVRVYLDIRTGDDPADSDDVPELPDSPQLTGEVGGGG